jgi:hypothetical protein
MTRSHSNEAKAFVASLQSKRHSFRPQADLTGRPVAESGIS